MAFDENLASRVRALVTHTDGMLEKKMFGGAAFLLRGNMSVGVHGDELIVRVDPAETNAALGEAGVRLFDITGRPMKGWLLVAAAALADDAALTQWVTRGVSYAASLPPK